MRKLARVLPLALLLALTYGCGNFAVNLQHTYMTATDLAHGGYVGYTNWYVLQTNGASPQRLQQLEEDRLKVKSARMDFAATVGVLDDATMAYQTNSALKPFLQATIQTVLDKSSNIVWVINFVKQH